MTGEFNLKRRISKSNPQAGHRRRAASALIAAAVSGAAAHHLVAATYTYSNVTSNWSTAAWSPSVPPSNDPTTILSFGGSGATTYTATNDIAAGFQLNQILLGSTATVAETLNGSSLAFSPAGSIVQGGTGAFNISNAITLNSDFLNISNTSTGSLSLLGVISGSGGLQKSGGANLTLGAANTFTGGVNFSSGTLYLNNIAGLGTGTLSETNANTSVSLDLSGLAVGQTLANAITLPADTSATTHTLNINGSTGTTKFSGLISGGSTNSKFYLNTSAGTSSAIFEFSNSGSSFITGTGTTNGIVLNRGTLQIDNAGALGNASNSVYLDSYSPNSIIFGSSFTYTHPTYVAYSTSAFNTQGYAITASGVISSASGIGLTKTGAGVLTLSATNTYAGVTTVSAGSLVAAFPSALPSANFANVAVASGATLAGRTGGTGDFTLANLETLRTTGNFSSGAYFGIDTSDGNFTYANDVGAGGHTALGLNKLGTNTLTLTNTAPTYTGGTQISAGAIIPTTANALGSGNIIVASGASLQIPSGLSFNSNATFYANVGGANPANATSGSAGTLNLNSSTGTAANPDVVFGNNHSGNSYDGADISANVNLGNTQRYIWGYSSHNGVGQYGITKADAQFAGTLSGTGGITIIGKNDTANTDMAVGFALTGSNTFTGPVVIQGGSVYLGNTSALTQSNALSMTPASGDFSRFFLYGNSVTVSNLTSSGAGVSTIANGNKATLASTAVAAATLTVNQTTNTTFAGNIADEFYEYSGTGTQTQGNLSLIKTGSAGLVLNGTLSYTGATTINAGRLEIDSAATTSAVTVNATGTLAGVGTIAGGVQINNGGTLEAGNSGVGNLTVGSLSIGVNSGDTAAINATSVAVIVDNGSLNIVNGAIATINVGGAASNLTVGTSYPLITYNGSTTALTQSQVNSSFVLGAQPTRVLGSLVAGFNGSNNAIDYVVTGVDFPVWTGAVSNSWNTTDSNWVLNSNNATATKYMPGDAVLFSDLAGPGHTTITLNSGDVTPGGVTFNTSLNYSLSGSNGIAGATGLTVMGNSTGNGSLTISNTNSFTGNVTVNNASLIASSIANSGVASAIGAGTTVTLNNGTLGYSGSTAASTNRVIALGSGGGAINISTAGTSLAVTGGITGSSTLAVSGAGALIMGAANPSFTGPIVVNSGNLSISADSQLGAVPAAVTPAAITLAGTGTLTTTAGFTLSGNRGITGTGSLIVNGGTLVMTGSDTYSGGTQLSAGALSITNGSELGSGPLSVNLSTGTTFLTVANNAAVTVPNAIVLPTSLSTAQTFVLVKNSASSTTGTQLTLAGNISSGSSNLKLELNSSAQSDYSTTYALTGSNSFVGTIDINRGSLVVSNPASLGNASNLLILDSNSNAAAGNLQFASSFTLPNPIQMNASYPIGTGGNNDVLSGAVSGAGPLVKVGTGVLTTTATNTYGSGTTINGGTLQVGSGGTAGALPAVNVTDNGTLAFNRSDKVTFSPVITGTGGLTKYGAGTLVLSNTHTFSGPTVINAGTLEIDGALSNSSSVAINSSGTLTGSGVIAGPVNVNNGGSIAVNSTLTVGGLILGNLSTDLESLNFSNTSISQGLIQDTGTIAVDSGANSVTVNVGGVPPTNGQHVLVQYTGSPLTDLSEFKLGTLPLGVTANLVNDTANDSIDLVVTAGGDIPRWTGAYNSEWVTTPQPSPHNWQLAAAGTPVDYVDGNAVLFDDNASNPNVDISSGNVSPSGVTFNNNSLTYNITGSNGIAGGVAVVMNGYGTVVFNNTNTYTGGTTINNGTIVVNSSNTGANPGALGTGTVLMGSSVAGNGYSASLLLGTASSSGGVTFSNPITVQSGSNGTLTLGGQNNSGVNAFTGNITLGNGTTGQTLNLSETSGGELDINGNITASNTSNLVINGGSYSGLVVLNGTASIGGTITINQGTLQTNNLTVPAGNNEVVINGGASLVSIGTLALTPTTSATLGNITPVSGGGTLYLNSSTASLSHPDMNANLPSSAYYALTVATNIFLAPGEHFITGESGNNSFGRYGTGDLGLTGQLSGPGNLTIYGTPASSQFEVLLYNDNSNWTGNLTINRGDVAAATTNALTVNQNVTFNPAAGNTAALYLFGIDTSIGNLSGATAGTMYIRNGSSSTGSGYYNNCTLTVTQTTDGVFNGLISNGPNDYYGGTASDQTLALTKTGNANLVLGGSSNYTGDTNINAGALTLTRTGAISASNIYVNSGGTLNLQTSAGAGILVRKMAGQLTINGGGVMNVATAASHGDRQVIAPAAFNNYGLVDLGGNDMDLPASTGLYNIVSQIQAGFAGGAWNGASGIISTAAANDPTHLTTLGVISNDVGGTPLYGSAGSISSTFSNVVPNDGDILVKYTYYGDANLDGQVDGSDYTLIDNGYNNGLTGWYNGDFNYDGVIDGSDYTLIDNAFNTQGASFATQLGLISAQVSGGGSAVPEPASLGMVLLTGGLLCGRRRK